MLDESKRVSIAIPVFNLQSTIERCVGSIVSQSYSNIEVLLIDDGSTDQSLQLCKELYVGDNRFKRLHHENHGVSFTRNRGMTEASGDFIIFIDGDDEIAPDMIEKYVSAFSPEIDMVIGGITKIEEDGSICIKQPNLGVHSRKELLTYICKDDSGIYGYVPNKMYRANIIRSHNVNFREDMAAQEDLEFALSVFEVVDQIKCISYSGYYYYHQQMKREMPTVDLLANQLKLCRIARDNGCDITNAVRRLQDQVYTSVFWMTQIEDIERLRMQPNLLRYLSLVKPIGYEKRFVISAFISGKTDILYRYFKKRQKFKKLLGKRV